MNSWETNLDTSWSKADLVANAAADQQSTGDRLRAEVDLLGSLPDHVGDGIVKSIKSTWDHKLAAGAELTAGLVIGSVFTLVSRNPNRIAQATTTWLGRAFIGAAALDLTSRFAEPMHNVWMNPKDIEKNKILLGNKVGDAVFNYGIGIAGGIAGARLTERFVAPTKLGTWMQGFQEKTVTAGELSDLLAKPDIPAGKEKLAAMSKGFAAQIPDLPTESGLAESMAQLTGKKIKLRELPDGTQLGTVNDGSVMMITPEGTGYWFENKPSFFGLKPKLELARIHHSDGSISHLTPGRPIMPAGSRGSTFTGRDPSAYFENGGAAGSAFEIQGGAKVTTDARGALTGIETESGSLINNKPGDWSFTPSAKPKLMDPAGTVEEAQRIASVTGAYNLRALTDWFFGYKKGAEAGFAARFFEKTADLGSGVVQHELINKLPVNQGSIQGDNGAGIRSKKDNP